MVGDSVGQVARLPGFKSQLCQLQLTGQVLNFCVPVSHLIWLLGEVNEFIHRKLLE